MLKMNSYPKLLYITDVRLPTEKAHGLQIMKMCEAFAKTGHDVELIVPKRVQQEKTLLPTFDYYGIEPVFSIKQLSNTDFLYLDVKNHFIDNLLYCLHVFTFTLSAVSYMLFKSGIIYTRNKIVAAVFIIMGRVVVYEAHDRTSKTALDRFMAGRSSLLVTITKSIDRSWQELGANTVYAPDAVGQEAFVSLSQEESRAKLNLNPNRPMVVYTGNFYPWKGVATLLEAAVLLPQFEFYLVGGEREAEFRQYIKKYNHLDHIHFIGNRPHQEIPLWLKAADVLVIPNSAKTKKGKEDTSPLKLFEYLASGTSIIASDIPALREIVNEDLIVFFTPDDPKSLVEAIKSFQDNDNREVQRQTLAKQYSWNNRAKIIIESINNA